MLSVIIPTLNEQNYLPKLLTSIKRQGFSDYEIIVADAGSSDGTVEVAGGYGCKVIQGGLPAYGRNRGAEVAKGALLLFLDADVVLPDGFFEKALAEYEARRLKIASFGLVPVPKSKKYSLLFNIFYNVPIRCLEHLLPHAAMAILMERAIFEMVGGFDETIKIAEDHELARRVKKLGKYGLIKSVKIFVSPRRFEKDGGLRTYLKFLLAELYMIFRGPIRRELFRYQFDHHNTESGRKVARQQPR